MVSNVLPHHLRNDTFSVRNVAYLLRLRGVLMANEGNQHSHLVRLAFACTLVDLFRGLFIDFNLSITRTERNCQPRNAHFLSFNQIVTHF